MGLFSSFPTEEQQRNRQLTNNGEMTFAQVQSFFGGPVVQVDVPVAPKQPQPQSQPFQTSAAAAAVKPTIVPANAQAPDSSTWFGQDSGHVDVFASISMPNSQLYPAPSALR